MTERGSRLGAVVRFYELELETARIERVAADERCGKQKALAADIQRHIDNAQAVTRSHMQSDGGVSADALRQWGAYTKWNSKRLEEQQQKVREAEKAAEQARLEVTRRFQALAAIEQLRERRARDAAFEAARAEQKALDEHALTRMARTLGPGTN